METFFVVGIAVSFVAVFVGFAWILYGMFRVMGQGLFAPTDDAAERMQRVGFLTMLSGFVGFCISLVGLLLTYYFRST